MNICFFSKEQIYMSNEITVCYLYIHQYFFYGSQFISCTVLKKKANNDFLSLQYYFLQ